MTNSISPKDVQHMTSLARLGIPGEQLLQLTKDLESILGHVEELKQLDVSRTLPMAHAVEATMQTREDREEPALGPKGLEGSAGREGRFVRVPKIIE